MKYQKQVSVQGAWVKASELTDGTKAKLVSETEPSEGEYGKQDTAKIRIEGDTETKNVRINKTTLNGLIDAFGDDSKDWINKELTVKTEKALVGSKRVTILYLIAENFELGEDKGGYLVIRNMDKSKVVKDMGDDIPVVEPKEGDDVDVKDIPF